MTKSELAKIDLSQIQTKPVGGFPTHLIWSFDHLVLAVRKPPGFLSIAYLNLDGIKDDSSCDILWYARRVVHLTTNQGWYVSTTEVDKLLPILENIHLIYKQLKGECDLTQLPPTNSLDLLLEETC